MASNNGKPMNPKVFNRDVEGHVFHMRGRTAVINGVTVRVYASDENGKILIGGTTGTVSSLDSQSVFAKSALIIKTNETTGTPGLYENVGTSSSSSFNLIGQIASGDIADGAVTPIKMAASQALTATDDGLTTGIMAATSSHAVVTSAGATKAITLPASAAGLIGRPFTIWVGANGFELLTPAASNATINGTDSDGTNQADIPANSLSRLTLVNTNTWILENIGSTGTVAAAIIPDND